MWRFIFTTVTLRAFLVDTASSRVIFTAISTAIVFNIVALMSTKLKRRARVLTSQDYLLSSEEKEKKKKEEEELKMRRKLEKEESKRKF